MTEDRRRRGVPFAFVPAVLFCLVATSIARGQGLPVLPDPVDTHTLMAYADLMELSDQQRAGLAPVHDAYLERYRELRDTRIQEFLDSILDIGMRFGRGSFAFPERDEVEKIVSTHASLLDRIHQLDRSLFDQVQTMLIEQQLPALERARTLRRLDHYWLVTEGVGSDFNPGAGVNLTELMPEGAMAELDPERRDAVVLRLTQYETTLLRKVRDLYTTIQELIAYVLDTIDEWGLRDMELHELAALGADEAFQQQMMARFDVGSEKFQLAAADLSEFNLRTFRALFELLDETGRQQLRDVYYRRVYGRVYEGDGAWQMRYHAALQGEISDELRTQIELERAHFRRQQQELDDKLVAELEASRRYRTAEQMDDRGALANAAQMDELRQRRRENGEAAERRLTALLGPALAESGADEGVEAEPARTLVSVGVGPDGSQVVVERRGPRPMRYGVDLPGPIPAAEPERLLSLLGWGADQQPVVGGLYALYREDYDALREAFDAAPPAGDADDHEREESEPIEQLRALDDRFYDDVRAVAATEDDRAMIDRLQLERQRARQLAVVGSMGSYGGPEGRVDLVTLICTGAARRDMVTGIGPLLDEYGDAVTPLREQQRDLTFTSWRTMRALDDARSKSGPAATEFAERLQKRRGDQIREMSVLGRKVAAANRKTLEAIIAALPASEGLGLRERFFREAHPDEFSDAKMVERLLEEASGLPDLTDEQRARLSEASVSYRHQYFDVSRRRIDAASGDFNNRPERDQIEREIQRERLRFDRNEISARTIMQIQLVLSDAQEAALPDLRRWQPTGAPWD